LIFLSLPALKYTSISLQKLEKLKRKRTKNSATRI